MRPIEFSYPEQSQYIIDGGGLQLPTSDPSRLGGGGVRRVVQIVVQIWQYHVANQKENEIDC